MTDTIKQILDWHRAACPEPDIRAISVQIGCHYEEVAEMADALAEVARSNDSKMVDGRFEYDANGKVMKPDGYSPPNLAPFLGDRT